MQRRHIQSLAFVLAAFVSTGTMAQEREPVSFEQEMQILGKTWKSPCTHSYGWKDEGASCQKWIDAIDHAAARPHATPQNKRSAVIQRIYVRREYAMGLMHHARKPERALEEYNKAFADMKALLEAGDRNILLYGYEVLTGMARALQETGDIQNSDFMYGQARSLAENLREILEKNGDKINPTHRNRIFQVLDGSESAERLWAQQLSDRAAQRAVAGDQKAAVQLWSQAVNAYGQAVHSLTAAAQADGVKGVSALIPPDLRLAGFHRQMGDLWLLMHASGQAGNSLELARDNYRKSQAHAMKAEGKFASSQPRLGFKGESMQGSQIGLAEVLAREGKLAQASRILQSVQKELAPISRREMAELAKQGKAGKQWLWTDIAFDSAQCKDGFKVSDGSGFCNDVMPGVAKLVSDRMLDELLPRFGEKDIDGWRLHARLLTAKARWMGGSWQEARAAWEYVRSLAVDENGKRNVVLIANDEYQLLQATQEAKARGAVAR